MLFHQMKVAALLLLLGIGGTSWAWHAFAGSADERGQAGAGKTIAGTPTSAKRSAVIQKPTPPRTDTHPITITGRAVDPDGQAGGGRLTSTWRRGKPPTGESPRPSPMARDVTHSAMWNSPSSVHSQ